MRPMACCMEMGCRDPSMMQTAHGHDPECKLRSHKQVSNPVKLGQASEIARRPRICTQAHAILLQTVPSRIDEECFCGKGGSMISGATATVTGQYSMKQSWPKIYQYQKGGRRAQVFRERLVSIQPCYRLLGEELFKLAHKGHYRLRKRGAPPRL